MGLFSLLNTLVSVIYPAYLSGRTIDESLKVSRRVKGSTINLGSFSVPVTLLGLGDRGRQPAISDEQSLQILSLTLHKLVAYWTVQGAVVLAETVLFIPAVVPFYSLLRLGLSVWLVFPLFSGTTVSKTWDMDDEWSMFCRLGAGSVFARFLQPLVSHAEPLSQSPVDVAVQYVEQLLRLMNVPPGRLWQAVGAMAATETKEPVKDDSEEYDVVDKPLLAEAEGAPQRRKGWLW